jgi:hypothetical protein
LRPVVDSNKYEALNFQVESASFNRTCTIHLIKSLFDIVHEQSEDFADLDFVAMSTDEFILGCRSRELTTGPVDLKHCVLRLSEKSDCRAPRDTTTITSSHDCQTRDIIPQVCPGGAEKAFL